MKYRLQQLALVVGATLKSKKELSPKEKKELVTFCIEALKACDIPAQDVLSTVHGVYEQQEEEEIPREEAKDASFLA